MKILQSWLKKQIAFTMSPEDLAGRLGMLGLEVESVERLGEKYRGFVVGKVVDCSRHPHADRLTVCRVNVGKETLPIVCGAPNVAAGQKVVVARVGTTIPRNQHDPSGPPFLLSAATIRGVTSDGMICSEFELDLGNDSEGIMVLEETAHPGQPLADYLGLNEVVYDIAVTPNRPDWLSHAGVAREIGILTGKRPSLPDVRVREGKESIKNYLAVTVNDTENCPRFAARMIRGVTIGPSPQWMQNTLRNVGLRPINNVVDVTNYVMYEMGHPLHAFDYALLRGGKIVVRQAEPGTHFRTLDGKGHTLPGGTVVVCDAEREVSVAGIMGGENSEIRNTTNDLVLEAAYWRPSSIRRTAKALGIISDASQRFERGADPNGILPALDRAAQLVLEVAGGTLLRGTIDVYPKKIRPRAVTVRPSRVNAVLGTHLRKGEILQFLRLLNIRVVRSQQDAILCSVPTFRVDLEREIDLVEEIARVLGYDNIEEKTVATVDVRRMGKEVPLVDRVRNMLVGAGFREVVTNPMQDVQRASLEGDTPVRILNPLGADMSCLRTSLIPGLLDVAFRNQSYGSTDLRLFEVGHVFRVDAESTLRLVEDYHEEERVCLLLTGHADPPHWSNQGRTVDFFDIKGEVEDFLSKIALDKWRFISYSTSDSLTESTLGIEIQGSYAGRLGKVKEEVRRSAGLENDLFVAELLLHSLDVQAASSYRSLPRFPRVRRDIAFFVGAEIPAGEVEAVISESGGELLQSVCLFDVYEGEAAGVGKKSFAFTLELMSLEKTLTDAEIDEVVQQVVRAVERRFGAVLRRA